MSQRIKGQETQILMVVDGQIQDTITDVRSHEMTFQLEILREGYIGETSQRRDEIFNGVAGKMELHFENDDILGLFQAIIDRARRRTPGVIINVKTSLNFPNGDRPRIILPNCSFGDLPLNFGSRQDYGASSLTYETDRFSFLG